MKVRIQTHTRRHEGKPALYEGDLSHVYVEVGDETNGDECVLIQAGPDGTVQIRIRDRRLLVIPEASNTIRIKAGDR